jgi:hypothetical protein
VITLKSTTKKIAAVGRSPVQTLITLTRVSLTRPIPAQKSDHDASETTEPTTVSGIIRVEGGAILPVVTMRVTDDETDEVIQTTILNPRTKGGKGKGASVEFKFSPPRIGRFNLTFSAAHYDTANYLVIRQEPGRKRVSNEVVEVIPLLVITADGTPVEKLSAVNVVLQPREKSGEEDLGPLINTTDAVRLSVFQPRLMEALPLASSRSFDSLALLAPGVLPPPESIGTSGPGVSPGVGTPGQFSVNGLRSRENNFNVDGSDNNDEDAGVRRQGFLFLAPQPVESLSEFQIITALADARFGRNLGGQVNALTKTGGGHYHGSFYGRLTNDRFNARDPFDQTLNGAPASFALTRSTDNTPVMIDGRPLVVQNPAGGKDPFTRWQAGATASGPLKPFENAFFFASVERMRVRARRESHFAVPTVKQRGLFDSGETGLFTAQSGGPQRLPLYPTSIPGDAIFSLYPFPNDPLGPYGQNTYTTVLPEDGDGTRFAIKLYKQLGQRSSGRKFQLRRLFWISHGDVMVGRYNLAQEASIIPVTGEALFSTLRPNVRTQNLSFFLNRTLAANLFDAIRFSWGRTRLSFGEVRDPFLSPSSFFPDTPFLLNAPLLLNVTAPNQDGTLNRTSYVSASNPQGAAILGSLGYPHITSAEQIAGALGQVVIPGFSPLGVDVNYFPQSRANNTFQIADTLTNTRGRTVLTFGFDVRKNQINSVQDKGFRPSAVFNGLNATFPPDFISLQRPDGTRLPALSYSGSTLAAAGAPTGLFQTLAAVPNSSIGIRFSQIHIFLQGNRRVTKKLSLTLGVRYELNTVPETVNRKLEGAFDPAELRDEINSALPVCSRLLGQARCNELGAALAAEFPASFKIAFASDKHDFNGRAGFAWEPFTNGKTVIRGGFGTYTGQFNGLVLGQSRNTFPNFLSLNLAESPRTHLVGHSVATTFLYNPANPLLLAAGLTNLNNVIVPGTLNTLSPNESPVSVLINRLGIIQNLSRGAGIFQVPGLTLVLPQERLTAPYALQFGITAERQFGKRWLASIAYVGTRGVKLLRISTPEGGFNFSRFGITGEIFPGTSMPNATSLQIRPLGNSPFPDWLGSILPPRGQIVDGALAIPRTLFESSGTSTYNSLQAELRKRYNRHLQFGTAFTYSHSIDDASDYLDLAGAYALPQDSFQRSEKASSNFDVRLRSVTHFVLDLPVFVRNREGHSLGGLQLAGVITAQKGQPFTVNSAFDINADGNLTDRLNNTSGLMDGEGRTQLRLVPGTDPRSLLAPDGVSGAVGRNTFRAPSVFSFDMALKSNVGFSEGRKFQYGVEILNLFNRANYGIPVRILEAPGFGTSVDTTVPARTVQFTMKFQF